MPQTYRDYAVREIALHVFDRLEDNFEHAQAGDIVTVRDPSPGIGTKERAGFLWLHVSGKDTDVADDYRVPNYEPIGKYIKSAKDFDKRRFCIPLARLKLLIPRLDLARVADTADEYQPFLVTDEDSGEFLTKPRPLDMHGLIYDKAFRRFV